MVAPDLEVSETGESPVTAAMSAANDSVSLVGSGGLSSSGVGLKGTEDLGGGLKAVFALEQGFNADNGTQAVANSAFSRNSYVGLSGGFGTVTFGTWSLPIE